MIKQIGMTQKEQAAWLAQWQAAESALRKQKMKELAAMSDDQVRQSVAILLALAGRIEPDPRRWRTSGLVEQQRWFRRHLAG
jgi:hypothetical protein